MSTKSINQHSGEDVTAFNEVAPAALLPSHAGEYGGYTLFQSTFKSALPSDSPYQSGALSMSGPHGDMAAAVAPAIELFRESNPNPLHGIREGERITALVADNYSIRTLTGRYFGFHGTNPVLRPGRTRGACDVSLAGRSRTLLWAQGGAAAQDALNAWRDVVSKTPRVAMFEFGRTPLDDLPSGDDFGGDARAAFVLNHPGFGSGDSRGALFLATGYDRENDFVPGYYWSPNRATVSETGGFSVGELRRWAGRVIGFQPTATPWNIWVDGMPRAEAYAAVLNACQ